MNKEMGDISDGEDREGWQGSEGSQARSVRGGVRVGTYAFCVHSCIFVPANLGVSSFSGFCADNYRAALFFSIHQQQQQGITCRLPHPPPPHQCRIQRG